MSICMSVKMENVYILSKNKEAALIAINNAKIKPAYTFSNDVYPKLYKNLHEVFEDWAYDSKENDSGDIEVEFNGEKFNDDDLLWRVLAPFINPEAIIQLDFEAGCEEPSLQYRFEGGKFSIYEAITTWKLLEVED